MGLNTIGVACNRKDLFRVLFRALVEVSIPVIKRKASIIITSVMGVRQTFGLFSNNLQKEVINNNDFEENNVDEQTSQFDEINSYMDNEDEEDIEFIKLDLNDNVNQIEEIKTGEEESNNETIDYQEDNYLFEKPIQVDSDSENIIRRENLKKYNHVFKSNNSSIEDLEKIPAYKRMGIEINNSKSEGDEIFSKTILNEENKLEFPDVNTYLHDNVD